MAESNRAEHQHKVEETPSRAILRHNKLSNNCIGKFSNVNVGAGALDSPLEGARFELSRAHVENIMWITQMRLQTKCRRGGTSGAPSPTSVIG